MVVGCDYNVWAQQYDNNNKNISINSWNVMHYGADNGRFGILGICRHAISIITMPFWVWLLCFVYAVIVVYCEFYAIFVLWKLLLLDWALSHNLIKITSSRYKFYWPTFEWVIRNLCMHVYWYILILRHIIRNKSDFLIKLHFKPKIENA